MSTNNQIFPVVQKQSDLCYEGQIVRVLGVYEQFRLRTQGNFQGHVSIRLSDSVLILLGVTWVTDVSRCEQLPNSSPFREVKEILHYEGKMVEVVGRLHSNTPNCPDENVAYLSGMPCISEIQEIRLCK